MERELIRHFPNGILILCDHDLRWVIVDGQELTRTGRTPGDMEGRTIHELYPPEVCARIEPFIRRVLAGEEVSYDAELLGKRYFVQGVPVYENGRVAYAALATQDQTQLLERLDRASKPSSRRRPISSPRRSRARPSARRSSPSTARGSR